MQQKNMISFRPIDHWFIDLTTGEPDNKPFGLTRGGSLEETHHATPFAPATCVSHRNLFLKARWQAILWTFLFLDGPFSGLTAATGTAVKVLGCSEIWLNIFIKREKHAMDAGLKLKWDRMPFSYWIDSNIRTRVSLKSLIFNEVWLNWYKLMKLYACIGMS